MGDPKTTGSAQAPRLVKRTCACGCGNHWRTLPESDWWYFSQSHAVNDGELVVSVGGKPGKKGDRVNPEEERELKKALLKSRLADGNSKLKIR